MNVHIYKNPEAYSKVNTLQYNFAMEVLSKIKISENERILDLGCGDGRITYEIAKRAFKGVVIGTDISEKMIEHANKMYRPQKNLRFMTMDTSINVFQNQFDVITSFNSLHWVKDQEEALRGIAKAAVDNAKIVLLLSHRKSIYHMTLDMLCNSSRWKTYFKSYSNPRSFFTKGYYEALLSSAGLKVVTMNEKEMSYDFASVIELKAFISASMANIKQIPDDLKNDFLEDYCIEFMNLTECKNQNRIPLTFWCLHVSAFFYVSS